MTTDDQHFALIVEIVGEEGEWQERALCAQVDADLFYPEKGGSTKEAKSVCMTCEVRAECLEAAIDRDERFGIWGGMSERDRRALRKQRMVDARGPEILEMLLAGMHPSEVVASTGLPYADVVRIRDAGSASTNGTAA